MELTQKEVNEKLTERGFRVKPENKLALSIKELKNILESFESLFKFPRLYLSKRFDTIRSEIDLAYEKQATIKISEEMKNKLKDNYLSMINLVNSHETECFKHFPNPGSPYFFSSLQNNHAHLLPIYIHDERYFTPHTSFQTGLLLFCHQQSINLVANHSVNDTRVGGVIF